VKFLGDVSGEFTREFDLPAAGGPEYELFPQDDKGIAPSGMQFRLTSHDNVVEVEPNETIAAATKGAATAAFNGVLSSKTDVDYFGFTATKGQAIGINVYARRIRSELDPVLILYNAQGGAIASNDDARSPNDKTVLRDAFAAAKRPAEIQVYADAMHGWCVIDSKVYNQPQAERAWGRMLDLFRKQL